MSTYQSKNQSNSVEVAEPICELKSDHKLVNQVDEIFVHINKLDSFAPKIVEQNKDLAPKSLELTNFEREKDPVITKRKLSHAENQGRKVSKQFPELRDLAVVMEHPEFHSFYTKYMSDSTSLKQMLVLMKMYDTISKFMKNKDPNEEHHNAYHKLVFLHKLLMHPVYSRILFKKQTHPAIGI